MTLRRGQCARGYSALPGANMVRLSDKLLLTDKLWDTLTSKLHQAGLRS